MKHDRYGTSFITIHVDGDAVGVLGVGIDGDVQLITRGDYGTDYLELLW